MINFAVTRSLALPADRLWPLLGAFSRLPDWFPGIDDFRSEGDTVGSLRHIRIGPFEITQHLLEQDNTAFKTVYQVTQGPGISPATGFIVTIQLESAGNACTVHWSAQLQQLPTMMPPGSEPVFMARTQKNYEQALDHLEQVLVKLDML
jgi:carbon monoxide dehydrogenase subunit G